MFDPVDPRQNFPALERGIQKYWQEEDTFKRSIHLRSARGSGDLLNGPAGAEKEERFSFYDGPPFATGLPHYGHLLCGTIKDVIPRYQTMRGKRIERRFGWDCHGLPIENIIEKENNLVSKKQIEEIGVKAFNDLCRKAVLRYTKEWRTVVERMGRWVDMDWDYRTMDADYMESIWWAFKSLADKNLIYEGHKPMHVCPRCGTPLSNFEVTQGYKDVTDQSVTAMFALEDSKESRESKDQTFILAWTTTPWTLPGNLFLAVHPKTKYVTVLSEGKRYIVAQERSELVFKGKEFSIDGKPFTGKSLIGRTYTPLFPYFAEKYKESGFRIVAGDFVTTTDGTGVVHIAPGFGTDDFNVGQREKVPVLQHVSMDGKFTKDVTDFAELDVKPMDDPTKTDKKIAEWLEKHGNLFSRESYKHSYPHCWRCDHPLLNYATSSWFVAVEKIKEKMLNANSKTRWVPDHLRDGRFGKWLEGARDWAISRNRYWGTPLPIWRCAETKELDVIGSRDDLMSRMPIRFTKVTVLRHAESEGNVTPRYQGLVPGTDLTTNGKKQAKQTAEGLRSTNVTYIYCSPLARTRQTAQAIADATGAELIVDDRLREVGFGDYEGKSVDFSDLTFIKARRAHKIETGKVESIYHFPGMETWSGVQGRIKSFNDEILTRHRGEHIVIVTHADPALNFKHFFTGEDPAKLCHQPYPYFAAPSSYFWDHDTQAQLDLHKETVDDILWLGKEDETSVEVTIVRHGETDFNAQDVNQGSGTDVPLNDRGRKQVLESAKKLAKKKFDVIISSDRKRAVETAEILSKELGIPHTGKWPEWNERWDGSWEGRAMKDLLAEFPNLDPETMHTASFHHLAPPDAETLSTFLKRIQKGCERLRKEYPGKRVLIAGHGGMIRCFMALTQRMTYREAAALNPDNADATVVSLNPLYRRIPEVLDCWFESGSMPYAQSHFPFDNCGLRIADYEKSHNPKSEIRNPPLPPGFPADFIAEGIDQTRGWFYTLTILSAALFDKPAFMNCIVNGTVLAEDGKKMSKKLKNYPEPLVVAEKHGADAVRFALMSSPAVRGEDLRFSERNVEEVVRSVLLPLWNTYSFFVTYANAAKWEPVATRRTSGHPLDTWIRAEVQDLVNRMTHELDSYDLSATCAELHDAIDALTNWYVRLSRRRFAGKAGLHTTEEALEEMNEQDRLDALTTLYEVLITISQLLAPFCPFITDNIYLNLVPEKHGSIHLTDWPATRKLSKTEEKLLKKTRLLRVITSLGLKIRSDKKVKLRQPLAKATIAVPAGFLTNDEISGSELQLLQEEINVRAIDLVEDPGAIAEQFVFVDARKAGPRLGGRVQEIIAAGKRGEYTVKNDGSVIILDEVLSADEARVMYRGREGEDVAADKGIVVSLDTRITPELELQGKARDLIRAIQTLRKENDLKLEDRIVLSVEGADDIMKEHGETVLSATQGTLGKVEGEGHVVEMEGGTITVRFRKI